jgi:hypothetical protein
LLVRSKKGAVVMFDVVCHTASLVTLRTISDAGLQLRQAFAITVNGIFISRRESDGALPSGRLAP